MKTYLITALALACVAPALAQQGGRSVNSRLTTVTSNDPDWFTKTINIDFRNATLEEAIKKILEAAKVKLDKVDDQTQGRKSKLSLKLDDVNVRDALAAVSRLFGAQAYVLTEDGATTIELKKRTNDPISPLRSFGAFPSFGAGASSSSSGGGSGSAGFSTGGVFVTGSSERYKDLPEKTLDIQVKDGTALDVIKQICEKAGITYELEDKVSGDNKVSIAMRGVSVGNALDNAAGWLGCGWKAEKKGDKVKVYFGKKYPGPGYRWGISPNGAGQVFTTATPSMPLLPDIPIIGNLFRTSPSLSKRVSLDKKNTDVRECFKELLKDAELSYALADDLPSEPKSFTFSNVPLSTALDMICESIEVGWVTENGPDGKPLVRIGKRYKGRSRLGSSDVSVFTRSMAPSVTRYNELRRSPRVLVDRELL